MPTAREDLRGAIQRSPQKAKGHTKQALGQAIARPQD